MASKLITWDLYSRDLDQDAYYDNVATIIFQTWLPLMIEAVLADDLGEYFPLFAGSGYPQVNIFDSGMNISVGTKVLYEALLGDSSGIDQNFDFFNGQDPLDLIRSTLQSSLSQLQVRFGTDDIEDWKFPWQ